MNQDDLTDGPITKKIYGLPEFNEKESAQFQYDVALKNMQNNPTAQNIELFDIANRKLYEVQDAYRIGNRLLQEFHQSRISLA